MYSTRKPIEVKSEQEVEEKNNICFVESFNDYVDAFLSTLFDSQ